jgi:hypothetical protein
MDPLRVAVPNLEAVPKRRPLAGRSAGCQPAIVEMRPPSARTRHAARGTPHVNPEVLA